MYRLIAGTLIWILALELACPAAGQTAARLGVPATARGLELRCRVAHTWTEGGAEIVLLDGDVIILHGDERFLAERAVLWIYPVDDDAARSTVQAYMENGIRFPPSGGRIPFDRTFEQFDTAGTIRLRAGLRIADPAESAAVYRRALEERARRGHVAPGRSNTGIRQVVFEPMIGDDPAERRLRAYPRYGRPFEVQSRQISPDRTAVVVSGGIQLVLDNIPGLGTVDIAADRMVIWTLSAEAHKATQGGAQSQDVPLELYLEGNVVVRQGPRRIEADHMYYDVRGSVALIRGGELRSPLPKAPDIPLIVRADELRQLAAHQFQGDLVQITTSRFGVPGYRAEVGQATLREETVGDQVVRRTLTGRDNFLYIREIPVFYWPYIESPLEDIQSPLKRIRVRRDRTFGTQLLTAWNAFEVLGWEPPPGDWRWYFHADYLSKRGPAIGTSGEYESTGLFGLPGKYSGLFDAWGIQDDGKDRISRTRKNILPEKNTRGRVLWRHRQELPEDMTLIAEFAYLSDRNFLEQYFEREWEEDKDQETVLYLKQQRGVWAWSVAGRYRIMDFLTTTDYLPRADFYMFGQPLLPWLSYWTHSSVGYLDYRPGDFVPDPAGIAHDGGRIDTLHELSAPFSLGPVRVVPFVLGRATGWSEVNTGDDEFRLYGAAGVRSSLALWRVFPDIDSDLFNVHGLAHKMLFTADYYIANSDVPYTRLPLYDELDEDVEQVNRQRFIMREFAGSLPPQLDPQIYAIRTGLETAAETLDDLHAIRLGWRNRLQTKRGLPGARHIVDWATSDLSFTIFPNEDRDNFGELVGLIQYNSAWHLGDRTSILSNGWFEPFDNGPRFWSIGLYLDRPPRGSLLLAYSSMEPVDSEAIHFAYSYWMSPKWVSSFITRFDFAEDKNLGQSLILTRIGADFLFRLELDVDPLRDDFGISLAVFPRIDPDLLGGRTPGPRLPLSEAPVE